MELGLQEVLGYLCIFANGLSKLPQVVLQQKFQRYYCNQTLHDFDFWQTTNCKLQNANRNQTNLYNLHNTKVQKYRQTFLFIKI